MRYKHPNVKRRYYPKNWDRRGRVFSALNDHRMTQTDLCELLGINQGYLSSLIWGTQRSFSWEKRISAILGKSWEELFSKNQEEVAA